MKKVISFLYFLFLFINCFAQPEESDSLRTMEEVTVRAFEQNRNSKLTTASVKIIERNNADRYNKTSLLNGLNTVAGVRMEERSPGSYRINIRGSSLRSPFGVRNVKVYWNEIPITDPGGNTYFNQFAYNNFSYIEIFKGPAGSMYGSGTGGLVLLNNLDKWQPGTSFEYLTGSYNLQNIFASARFGTKENKNQFTYAHNQSNGFRQQTKLRRDNFSWYSQLKFSDKQQLSASVLFTDMYYQTPGALTLAEYKANPKAARPAGVGFPGAVTARAAIYQKNFTAGFTNNYSFSTFVKNSTTLYGAFTQIKNPAIRNYERRNEPGYGARTVFTYTRRQITNYSGKKESSFQLVGGSEFQKGLFNTQVAKNKNGNPDSIQTNDDINYTVYSLFIQGDLILKESWIINTGISLNKTRVEISRLSNYPVIKQSRSYRNELAPRFSIKKIFTDEFHLKATFSRGFSPPTIAELLPSTGIISTNLEAEYGLNYEMTAGFEFFKRRLIVEATGFCFKLNNALVQRRDISGADYFINAGDVKQKGIELHSDYTLSAKSQSVTDYIIIQADYTYNHFRYGNFKKGVDDYSGKTVPSVPANTFSLLTDINFKKRFYANLTYYTASKIFLNDANTSFTESYHLLGFRFGWKKLLKNKYKLNFYGGIDNLLDETYSSGNDINATSGRYYNAAPPRNYYAGFSYQWIKVPVKK